MVILKISSFNLIIWEYYFSYNIADVKHIYHLMTSPYTIFLSIFRFIVCTFVFIINIVFILLTTLHNKSSIRDLCIFILQMKQMRLKDSRIKLMNEVLNGIKVSHLSD